MERRQYADTGGSSDHVFSLAHRLGFRFPAPRLRPARHQAAARSQQGQLAGVRPLPQYQRVDDGEVGNGRQASERDGVKLLAIVEKHGLGVLG